MNIAVLGYGTVGSGVVDIIEQACTPYTKKLNVKYIYIRKGKAKTHPAMCDDLNTILQDTEVDVVVETIGGIDSAYSYIMQALQAGKHVVTANKAVVAKYLKEFIDCANKHNVHFYFEASTGGGIPWIASLQKAMRIDQIDQIQGIFNGTSNYILDHMERFQLDFAEVLAQAQKLGYAEADPSADIDGYDITNKLRISAMIAYDCIIPDTFPIYGIRTITKTDIDYFTSLKYHIRFIAMAKRNEKNYSCVVEPVLFYENKIESNVKNNYNIIMLHGNSIGELKFYGQGAGKNPTANAIIQDILDISDRNPHHIPLFENNLNFDKNLYVKDYILRANPRTYSLFKDYQVKEVIFEDTSYLHIKQIEVYQMHQYMKEIMQLDEHAFMTSIYEGENEND